MQDHRSFFEALGNETEEEVLTKQFQWWKHVPLGFTEIAELSIPQIIQRIDDIREQKGNAAMRQLSCVCFTSFILLCLVRLLIPLHPSFSI